MTQIIIAMEIINDNNNVFYNRSTFEFGNNGDVITLNIDNVYKFVKNILDLNSAQLAIYKALIDNDRLNKNKLINICKSKCAYSERTYYRELNDLLNKNIIEYKDNLYNINDKYNFNSFIKFNKYIIIKKK